MGRLCLWRCTLPGAHQDLCTSGPTIAPSCFHLNDSTCSVRLSKADSLHARVADGGEAVTPPPIGYCRVHGRCAQELVGCTNTAQTLQDAHSEVTKRCSVAQGAHAARQPAQYAEPLIALECSSAQALNHWYRRRWGLPGMCHAKVISSASRLGTLRECGSGYLWLPQS